MAVTLAEVTADMSDIRDLQFDTDVNIDAVEYSRIMRRIGNGIDSDESVPSVSAFNSSI